MMKWPGGSGEVGRGRTPGEEVRVSVPCREGPPALRSMGAVKSPSEVNPAVRPKATSLLRLVMVAH